MSISSTCPHCKANLQAPAGASEMTCPKCQKLVKLATADKGQDEAAPDRKQKTSAGPQFLDPEELKQSPFPVDQLAKEKRFQEALLRADPFSEFEETFDYLTEESFPGYQDQSPPPPGTAEAIPEDSPAPVSRSSATSPIQQEDFVEAAPSKQNSWNEVSYASESAPIEAGAHIVSPSHSPRRGHQSAASAAFDPCRPEEYLQALARMNNLDESTRSCIGEALQTYQAGCYKAAAVLLGVATERVYLDLRQSFMSAYGRLKQDMAWDQSGKARVLWRQMAQALYSQLKVGARKFPERAREWDRLARALDARVDGFSYLLRFGRDEAYRPANFEFITPGEVHAALALMPPLIELVHQLQYWTNKHLAAVVTPAAVPVKA